MRSLILVALVACAASADPARPSPPAPTPGNPATPANEPRAEPADPSGDRQPASPEIRVKNLVDRYRATVGLPPVILDPALSKGCMEHAEYMKLNKDTDAMAGLNAHHQRPNLPGATAAGAKCGKAADLFPGVSDLEVAVDGWMSGLYHRRPILTPTLAKIGVGYAKLPDGSLMAALMFVDNDNNTAMASKWPVAYPADKQRDVPLDFGNEVPNPIPGGGRAGYPITIQFPPFDKVFGVTATLVDAAGKAVPFYLSDPEHPATSFGQYGVVCVIPKQPLAPNTTYTISVSANWKTPNVYKWSFSTLSLRAVDAHDEAAVVKALNIASTLRGKVLHGGMMDTQTAFLQIGERTLKNYKMISVLIPKSVWSQLGGSPDKYVGKTIEVDGTPHLVQGQYINVVISVPGQLRLVR